MSDALITYARRLPAFELAMVLAIILLVVGFNAAEPRVLSSANIRNVLSQTSYLAIFACAQAMVILVRGFDLSLGTTISVVSVVTAMAMTSFTAVPVMAGFVAGLGAGLAIGIFNGFCVSWLKINPFIVHARHVQYFTCIEFYHQWRLPHCKAAGGILTKIFAGFCDRPTGFGIYGNSRGFDPRDGAAWNRVWSKTLLNWLEPSCGARGGNKYPRQFGSGVCCMLAPDCVWCDLTDGANRLG